MPGHPPEPPFQVESGWRSRRYFWESPTANPRPRRIGIPAEGGGSSEVSFEGFAMAGKFEIYKDSRGEFRFRLKSRNGEIVAQGESYTTRQGAKNDIAAVLRAAAGAKVEDLTDDS